MANNQILDGWFSEVCPMWEGRALSIKIDKCFIDTQTKYQHLQVFDTKNCGRMLVLDGIIQFTESDEFAYQEMLTHVPMFAHPKPEKVLVIGGGDGGVLREVAHHKTVKVIDICEIDEEVIRVSKEFIPSMSCGFDDPRVNVHIADGSEFIKERQSYYDVIIVDSSDPIGPGEALFESPFYESMKSALNENGIVATQGESFFMHPEIVKGLYKVVKNLFKVYAYSYMLVPTYPGGNIGVCIGSMNYKIKEPIRMPSEELQKKLKYYTPEIHEASFVLPAFGERMFAEI